MPCTWRPTNATLIWELVGQGGSLEATDKVGQGNYNGVVQICGGLCVLLRRSVCGVPRDGFGCPHIMQRSLTSLRWETHH